jgi:hypothetical protein
MLKKKATLMATLTPPVSYYPGFPDSGILAKSLTIPDLFAYRRSFGEDNPSNDQKGIRANENVDVRRVRLDL